MTDLDASDHDQALSAPENPPAGGGDLVQLEAEAAALDAGGDGTAAPGAAVPGPAEAPKPTNAEILTNAFGAACFAFCFATKLESPKAVLTDETNAKLGAAWGAVADHYRVDLHRYMGDATMPLLAAAYATFQVAQDLRRLVSAEIAQRAKDQAAAPQPIAAPDQAEAVAS